MQKSTTTTGAANQSPALKKHIEQNGASSKSADKKSSVQASRTTTGAANQSPALKKHLQDS